MRGLYVPLVTPYYHGKFDSSSLKNLVKLLERHVDGYLISLLNVEPKLCKKMLLQPSTKSNTEILERFWQYNLGGKWYISLKSVLQQRGIIKSGEEVNVEIRP